MYTEQLFTAYGKSPIVLCLWKRKCVDSQGGLTSILICVGTSPADKHCSFPAD